MGREEGGGFRMGNTGIPVADSFRYLAKLIQIVKFKNKIKFKKKSLLRMRKGSGTRWWRSRWMWSTSLSTDTSGTHLQTQKCMQNTS